MRQFHVSRARFAVGVVAIGGLAGGGVATAAEAPSSGVRVGVRAALVAKPAGVMPVVGQPGSPLVKVNPDGTLDPSAPSPAHCHYAPSTKKGATAGTISDAHRSTSVPGAIKVNSYVVCDHAVQPLTNETQLWKTGLLFDHLQAQTTTDNTGRRSCPTSARTGGAPTRRAPRGTESPTAPQTYISR